MITVVTHAGATGRRGRCTLAADIIIITIIIMIMILRRGEEIGCGQLGSTLMGPLKKQ